MTSFLKYIACIGKNKISKHIEIFNELDFNIYTNQKWDQLKKHSNNIIVHYPDGHITKGLNDRITELKKSFVFASDSRTKKVKMQMVTILHWNKDCVMNEEFLFYDNTEFANQLGMN
ncbi:hypothetical protein [Pigmentibacter ruber]|uniref:hypothetical protein n=1 Tax=Pigmentibacter ruber TaxID=2683196 RepID=UPI00131D88D0|nr:hypothetical protein [Pigmentibacter ruber]